MIARIIQMLINRSGSQFMTLSISFPIPRRGGALVQGFDRSRCPSKRLSGNRRVSLDHFAFGISKLFPQRPQFLVASGIRTVRISDRAGVKPQTLLKVPYSDVRPDLSCLTHIASCLMNYCILKALA